MNGIRGTKDPNSDEEYTRVLHTLLGVAYGDAMGMPTENLRRQDIRERFGTVDTFLPSPAGRMAIPRHLNAGEVTDDTELTVFTCESLLRGNGRLNAGDFVGHLINWLDTDSKSQYVVGPSTLRAVQAIKDGTPVEKAGVHGTTNGAAMKIAPVGLVCSYNDVELLVDQVAQVAMPTHNTRIAIQGASAIAMAVSYCFEHPIVDWDRLYALIETAVIEAGHCGIAQPGANLLSRIRYGWHLAECTDEEKFLDDLSGFIGTGLETIETVPAALAILRKRNASLRDCVVTAANIGGDTDTIGALCGGICGGNHYDITDTEEQTLLRANKIDFAALSARMTKLIHKTRRCS